MTKKLPILVVKIGTNALLGEHEAPRVAFDKVAESLRLLDGSYRIILVTSGAIGFGVRAQRLPVRPKSVGKLQALAMIGQAGLLDKWREALSPMVIGQVLVTRHDLSSFDALSNLSRSIEALWEYGALPIVNENDAVSYDEISFGDNDQLAAEIAVIMGAQQLVLLTNQDGVQADFGTAQQRRIQELSVHDMARHIVPSKSELGKGGLHSKVIAAALALNAGVDVYVGRLGASNSIGDVLSGKSGTRIVQ